jgi:hypothetical protein
MKLNQKQLTKNSVQAGAAVKGKPKQHGLAQKTGTRAGGWQKGGAY